MKCARTAIFALSCLAALVNLFAQTKSAWKEYVYAEDGFALKAPHEPKPHPDLQMANSTAYTARLSRDKLTDNVVTLRVVHEPRDCNALLGQLKDGVLTGKAPGAIASSLRNLTIDGHPGVEYEWNINPYSVMRERYYCVNGRFYIFSTSRPTGRPLPQDAARLIDSFRLLTTKASGKQH